MEYSERIYKVVVAIKELQKIIPKGRAMYLHPKEEALQGIRLLDLSAILHKLSREFMVIDVVSLPIESVIAQSEIGRQIEESYQIAILPKFEEYYSALLEVRTNAVGELRKPVITNQVNTNILCITYLPYIRAIVLNNYLLLSQPRENSINCKVFEYLYNHPNKPISRKHLETEMQDEDSKTEFTKRFHDITRELGFTKQLGQLFFSISKSYITFNNPITSQHWRDNNMEFIKVKIV